MMGKIYYYEVAELIDQIEDISELASLKIRIDVRIFNLRKSNSFVANTLQPNPESQENGLSF